MTPCAFPRSAKIADTWARFPFGVDFILNREGFRLARGFDAVLVGNIPGGGMSRSASLSVNLVLTMLEINGLAARSSLQVVDLAVVEGEFVVEAEDVGRGDREAIHTA